MDAKRGIITLLLILIVVFSSGCINIKKIYTPKSKLYVGVANEQQGKRISVTKNETRFIAPFNYTSKYPYEELKLKAGRYEVILSDELGRPLDIKSIDVKEKSISTVLFVYAYPDVINASSYGKERSLFGDFLTGAVNMTVQSNMTKEWLSFKEEPDKKAFKQTSKAVKKAWKAK